MRLVMAEGYCKIGCGREICDFRTLGREVYCGSFEVQREILRVRVGEAEMCTAVYEAERNQVQALQVL